MEEEDLTILQAGDWNDAWYHIILLGHRLNFIYFQISNISHTKSQHLNDSRLILQLSLPNLLKPCVKLRMKM